jgi:hypothetical protein
LGDIITITHQSSKKNIRARVTGPNQVEVVL